MVRWAWKRWVGAVLVGVAFVGAGSFAQVPTPPAPAGGSVEAAKDGPRPNDTITLRFPGQPDRKVTVVKVTLLADGNVESEVRDQVTGKAYTLVEPAWARAAAPTVATPVHQQPAATADAPDVASKPAPPADDDATVQAGGSDRRILPLLRPSTPPAPTPESSSGILVRPTLKPAAPAPEPGPASADDPARRPGPLQRLFSKRSLPPTMPAMPAPPAPTVTQPQQPTPVPGTPFPPPPVNKPSNTIPPPPFTVPTPMPMPGTVPPKPLPVATAPAVTTPSTPLPIPTPPMSVPTTTAEPPRAFAPKPVTPPTPVIPNAVPVPTAPPVTTPSLPAPVPTAVPRPMPTAPGGGPLPVIPLPGGQSRANGLAVMQAGGNVPPYMAMPQDIQPYVNVLHNALPPSQRILAAEALANGRHGSSSAVKAMLFNAAKNDPAPVVRACCIENLCKLGYFEPAFLEHLKAACDDPKEDVRDAAKAALAKMTRR